ncbi:MAG: chromosomal replication initiator protein DnaA [Verrucomicrobiota bacterium]
MDTQFVTIEVWASVLAELKSRFTADTYRTWFEKLEARWHGEETLILTAPNAFASIWLEDNYMDLVREKVRQRVGSEIEVVLATAEDEAPLVTPARGTPEPSTPSRLAASLPVSGPAPARARGMSAQKPKIYLNPRNTFENFIVGPSNQLAHAAATAVAAEPGNAYNPLFVYGDTGLGKTHIMHAVAHAIQARDPSAVVVYVSCEKFTNKFLKAIRENSLDQFRRFFRKVDVLLIDDIQFLEGKERTQEEFFHTFNDLFESQRQICLSSDRPAGEISKLEARLVSRFQWGMVTDIQAPDLETRVAILKKKAMAMGNHNVPDPVFEFLAARITRNVRRMEGALMKVVAYARLTSKPLDIATAERLVRDILQEEAHNQISVEKIQRCVVDYFDLRMGDMSSKRRPNNIAFPRQIAMYLSRLLTNLPLKEIGQEFGGRDHGTVIHACKIVEAMMEQDEKVKRNVEYLIKQLNGHGFFESR